jgi:hypothetical protein
MLDFASESVHRYWQGLAPELRELFALIEKTEDWTLDNHPDIGERLVNFGLRLADPQATKRLAAADKNSMLFFLVYISTSKAFRLINWMDAAQEGLGTRLLNHLLERDGEGIFANVADPSLAGVMVQRIRVIQNTPYLQKLLDPVLLGDILQAIDNYREERDSHEA